MMHGRKVITLIIGLCLFFPHYLYAHSGGTNDQGCHNDNINGGSHCHNSNSSSSGGDSDTVIIALGVVGGLAFWYYFLNDESYLSSSGISHQTNTQNNRYKLSLAPTSTTELDGARFQLSYEF